MKFAADDSQNTCYSSENQDMIFHVNHLLADDSHEISSLIFNENQEMDLKICRLLQS